MGWVITTHFLFVILQIAIVAIVVGNSERVVEISTAFQEVMPAVTNVEGEVTSYGGQHPILDFLRGLFPDFEGTTSTPTIDPETFDPLGFGGVAAIMLGMFTSMATFLGLLVDGFTVVAQIPYLGNLIILYWSAVIGVFIWRSFLFGGD